MPLSSRRFGGNATLVACADAGYRLMAGDTHADAVSLVQQSLVDLGYACPQTGQFDAGTGAAVTAFKTDEALVPNDPVVGSGTIGRLDGYFVWEPTDPDVPDPSTAGLVAVVEAAMGTAVGWANAAIASLNAWASGQILPADPLWVAREALLTRHLGIDPTTPVARREEVLDEVALPALHGVVRALAPPSPFLVIAPVDRVTFVQGPGGGVYAGAALATGAVLTVTPAFRNVWDPVAQAGVVLRAALAPAYPASQVLAFPISMRYVTLDPASRATNRMGLVSLAYETATATPAPFRPIPTW
ncbi:MAG: hypothetical protein R2737_00090 [Candidatus Nanopelagicales bacterium]